MRTTAGPVVLARPKVPGTTQPFASRLLGKGVSRTNALEALVISGFVRGLSTRDVEAALGEVPEAALRTFGESRRRIKVIGRLPGGTFCLRLVWAVLDRPSRGWRGLTYTPAATRLLQDLRRDLLAAPTSEEVIGEPVTTPA